MTRTGTRPPTLVVDLHRVVIDSEYALYRLWRDQFHQHGLLLTTEAWAEYRLGVTADTPTSDNPAAEVITDILARRAGVPIADLTGLARHLATQHREALVALPARPGITAWLQDAHRTGWRCVVLSRDDHIDAQDVLARLGLSDLVDAVIQTPPTRPSHGQDEPTGLCQQVLASLDADLPHAVAATASPTGIAHARAANCRCLAIPDKLNAHLLRPESLVAVVDPALISFPQAAALLDDSTRPPRRRTRNDPRRSDRTRGALAGLALGDAVGKLVGNRTKHQLDAETQHVLDALSADQPPPPIFTGRITDDTILALALADTIIETGHVSRDAFQTRLKTINPQGGWQVFKLKASRDQVVVARDGDTNGCVPRSAVLAFLHTPDTLGDLAYDVLKIGTLTHADPSALAAAVLFAAALTHAVDGYSPQETLAAIELLHVSVTRVVSGGEDIYETLQRNATAAGRFDSLAEYIDYLEDTSGTAATARSSAVTGLCLGLTGLPANQILPLLLRRRTRGDLDSTSAIYGALAGAFRPDSLPRGWTARIDQYCGRNLRDTADQLHRIHSVYGDEINERGPVHRTTSGSACSRQNRQA